MKLYKLLPAMLLMALALSTTNTVAAAPYTVQITQVEMNNNGLYVDSSGTAQAAIFVRGTFTPALPCAQQGFFIIASDPFEKETLAMLIAAKVAGTPIGYAHVYCFAANGYSRGNIVVLQ